MSNLPDANLPGFAARVTINRYLLGTRGSTARYDQLLAESASNAPPPALMRQPHAVAVRGLAIAAVLGFGLIGLGVALWMRWEAALGGIISIVVGSAMLGLVSRGWMVNRSLRGDDSHVGTALLQAADRAERRALAQAAAGHPEDARAALELAADRLRALAPGSGRSQQVLERAGALRDTASTLGTSDARGRSFPKP